MASSFFWVLFCHCIESLVSGDRDLPCAAFSGGTLDGFFSCSYAWQVFAGRGFAYAELHSVRGADLEADAVPVAGLGWR